jgi:hypothetical protein
MFIDTMDGEKLVFKASGKVRWQGGSWFPVRLFS